MLNSRLIYLLLTAIACLFVSIGFFDTSQNINDNSNAVKSKSNNCNSPFEFNKNCPVNFNIKNFDQYSLSSVLKSKNETIGDEVDAPDDQNATTKVDTDLELEIVQAIKNISQINISPLMGLLINDWRCTKDGVRPDLGLTQASCNALQNNRSLMNALLIQAQSTPQNASLIQDEYALYMDLKSQGSHYKTHFVPSEPD